MLFNLFLKKNEKSQHLNIPICNHSSCYIETGWVYREEKSDRIMYTKSSKYL